MGENEIYIRTRAYKLLEEAYKQRSNVYIYGITGYGKTALVQQFLKKGSYTYISCNDCPNRLNDVNIMEVKTIVIDDNSYLFDEEYRKKVVEILSCRNIWTIVIGRGKIPYWLETVHCRNPFRIIGEEDLKLNEEQIVQLFYKFGVKLGESEKNKIVEKSLGFPICMRYLAKEMEKGRKYNEELHNEALNVLFSYVEYSVYNTFSSDLLKLLTEISIVESFDKELAAMITGSDNVSCLLEQAVSIGNFLSVENGVYAFREHATSPFKKKLHREYSDSQIRELYYNAGLYYEMKGQLLLAMQMYEICKNNKRVVGLLIKNAKRTAVVSSFVELKNYYFDLNEKEIASSPELMACISLLHSLFMHIEESEKWYTALAKYVSGASGKMKKEALALLLYLDLCLPHRGNRDFESVVSRVYTEIENKGVYFTSFSATGNSPSVLNGGKDFSYIMSNNDIADSTIAESLEAVLGKLVQGAYEILRAEYLFQSGGDIYEIATLINRGLMKAQEGNRSELVFAGNCAKIRVSVFNGDFESAFDFVDTFEEAVLNRYSNGLSNKNHLLENARAVRAKLFLLKGNIDEAVGCMSQDNTEDIEFNVTKRYRYLVEARIFIVQKKYQQAKAILDSLIYYAQRYERYMIEIEAMTLLAIIEFRIENARWQETILEVLNRARKLNLRRMLSLEGNAIVPLLKGISLKTDFDKRVLSEATAIAVAFPAYLKISYVGDIYLNDTYKGILRLLSEGYSVSKIAEAMNMKIENVRYHKKQIYKKLGVNNKTDATKVANKNGLI